MCCFTRTPTSEDIVSALQGVSVDWPNTRGHTQRLHFLERASRTVNRMSHHGCMGSAELLAFSRMTCGVVFSWNSSLSPSQKKKRYTYTTNSKLSADGREVSEVASCVCVCWVWFSEIGQICSGQAASGWTTLSPEYYSVWAQVLLL